MRAVKPALKHDRSQKKKKKDLKWDEEVIAEHDQLRGTRMKVRILCIRSLLHDVMKQEVWKEVIHVFGVALLHSDRTCYTHSFFLYHFVPFYQRTVHFFSFLLL